MTDPSLPILYSFRRCPYAMRVRLGLLRAGKQVQLREVVLRDKPAQLLAISPKATVPVLQCEGRVIDESLDIVVWALATDPWMDADHELASALVENNDGPFKHHLDKYKYANRGEDANGQRNDHRAAAYEWLAQLDERLQHSSADGLVGTFGFADICIAPFVRQFAFVDKAHFDEQPLGHLQGWLERFLASDPFQRCMVKVPKWEPGQPPVLFGLDRCWHSA